MVNDKDTQQLRIKLKIFRNSIALCKKVYISFKKNWY